VGTAGIELVVDGRVASATVTVTAASAATLDVAPTRAVVQVGGTVQLKATPHDRAGAALANHSVSWQSSDPQTATVSATGAVSGARPGTVTITATSGTAVATATVVVEAVPAPGAVDQRPEIERVIETYRRAIEARDVTQLRSAYPGLTAEQERAWRDFYGSVTELAATFRVQDLQVSGDHATARVAATYDFRAGRRQTQNLDLTMTLEHRLGGWRLSSIK
jgi:ketosteroid isomerase-like protein